MYYSLKHESIYQNSDTIIKSVIDEGYLFRPQMGHHEANTELVIGPIKRAINGIPFRFQ